MRRKWAVVAAALMLAGCSSGIDAPAGGPGTTASTAAGTGTAAPGVPDTTAEPNNTTSVPPGGSSTPSLPPREDLEQVLPDLTGVTLGLRGLGPLRIGVSVNELAALGYEITHADCEVPYIQFEPNGLVAVRGGANGDPSGDETLTGLYFWFGTPSHPDDRNRELRTNSGIGDGSTRADVLATYGDQVAQKSVEIEDYDPDVQTFEDRVEFVPDGADDAGLRMIFSFDDDGYLLGIRTGEASAVQEPYLCD